jgi:cyclase
MKRALVLGWLIAAGTVSVVVAGQNAAPRAPLPDLTKVKENLYIIESSSPAERSMFTGGNTGVFIMDTGVLVVDTKLANYGNDILQRIRKVTDKPVTTIVNTHTHGDHTGSNEGFPASVEIVAHENTKANMTKMDAFKGENAQYLPSKTYSDKMAVGAGKDRVELYYFGAGHTNGDTFVVFPALRVLHTGDMFAWKDGPLCDRNNGGSCVAFPQTLSKAIAAIKNVDTVIPGHSPMQTPKDLQEFQRFVADLSKHAQDSMKAGKSVDEAFASFSVDKYPGYKNERVKGSIQAVYDELKK